MKSLKYFFLISGLLGLGAFIGIIYAVIDLIHHRSVFEATSLDLTIWWMMVGMYCLMCFGAGIVVSGSFRMMYRIHKRG